MFGNDSSLKLLFFRIHLCVKRLAWTGLNSDSFTLGIRLWFLAHGGVRCPKKLKHLRTGVVPLTCGVLCSCLHTDLPTVPSNFHFSAGAGSTAQLPNICFFCGMTRQGCKKESTSTCMWVSLCRHKESFLLPRVIWIFITPFASHLQSST